MDQFLGKNRSMIPTLQQFQYQQQQPFQKQQERPQIQQHPSLASHFHLYPLVEKIADAIENGRRNQPSDSLVSEANNHFKKCHQLLKSISDSISSKTMTLHGQNRKLEESHHLLTQRRDLIAKYKNSIDNIVTTDV